MQLRLLFCFCINLYEIHRLTNVFSECRIPCRGACCPGLKHLGRPHLMKKRSSHFNINQAQSEWHALDRHPLVICCVSQDVNQQMHPAEVEKIGGGGISSSAKKKEPTKMQSRVRVQTNVTAATLGGGFPSGAPSRGGPAASSPTSSSPRTSIPPSVQWFQFVKSRGRGCQQDDENG